MIKETETAKQTLAIWKEQYGALDTREIVQWIHQIETRATEDIVCTDFVVFAKRLLLLWWRQQIKAQVIVSARWTPLDIEALTVTEVDSEEPVVASLLRGGFPSF